MKIQHNGDYRRSRAKAYPSVGDALDAIYNFALAVQAAKLVQMPPAMTAWLDACSKVKSDYCKPASIAESATQEPENIQGR